MSFRKELHIENILFKEERKHEKESFGRFTCYSNGIIHGSMWWKRRRRREV